MKLKLGDPITVVLLAPDPYELLDARITYLDDYAPNPGWEWQTVGLTEQKVGTVCTLATRTSTGLAATATMCGQCYYLLAPRASAMFLAWT